MPKNKFQISIGLTNPKWENIFEELRLLFPINNKYNHIARVAIEDFYKRNKDKIENLKQKVNAVYWTSSPNLAVIS